MNAKGLSEYPLQSLLQIEGLAVVLVRGYRRDWRFTSGYSVGNMLIPPINVTLDAGDAQSRGNNHSRLKEITRIPKQNDNV